MPVSKKESTPGGGAVKLDSRAQNGNRSGFRTDTAISNSRPGTERTLKPWVPDSSDGVEGSLEASASSNGWDQFAENERLFGLKTDYDESIYTTAINRSHPQYMERIAAADRKAREIERSVPVTSHVAEERVMDYVGTKAANDDNEEEKYSGVRRQDFPPLNASAGRDNRYTPPAKRAPTSQSTVQGAPVDPAIISSQIRGPPKRQATAPNHAQSNDAGKNGELRQHETQKPSPAVPAEAKTSDVKLKPSSGELKNSDAKASHQAAATNVPSTANVANRNMIKDKKGDAPSAAATVELDVLTSFKSFASKQRLHAEKARSSKARADKEVKLAELKKFATTFKLSAPVPSDLVSIIAKDPTKQKEIQAKAIRNVEDVAKSKTETAARDRPHASRDAQTRPAEHNFPGVAADRTVRAPGAAQPPGSANINQQYAGPLSAYPPQPPHATSYRNNRGGPQHAPPQQTGNLAQRLRHMEQQRYMQTSSPGQYQTVSDARPPPTGPSSNPDVVFNRRHSGMPASSGGKLNPHSHEFRPSPFAAAFNPSNHPSAGSSPRIAGSHAAESPAPTAGPPGQLIRRKTKAVDAKKCCILSHIKTIKPPKGRNWDENGGLRPSYDTIPTWRQLQEDEKPESTMHLTYKEYFDRQPAPGSSLPTPGASHVAPQMAHQHQLPFHLQMGVHSGPRPSPHMPHVPMQGSQHGHPPHPHPGADDHRMMHSNSARSFASPRLGHLPVAYPPQVPYGQPMFMGPNHPHMGQYRSFSGSPHFVPPQQGQMGGPMMMQPHFIPGPQGMMAPQIMYHGGHPQFMPPSGPPQQAPAVNGYPSPGRAAAAMMHQGSHQGQPVFGMSPSAHYNQPIYGPEPAGTSNQ